MKKILLILLLFPSLLAFCHEKDSLSYKCIYFSNGLGVSLPISNSLYPYTEYDHNKTDVNSHGILSLKYSLVNFEFRLGRHFSIETMLQWFEMRAKTDVIFWRIYTYTGNGPHYMGDNIYFDEIYIKAFQVPVLFNLILEREKSMFTCGIGFAYCTINSNAVIRTYTSRVNNTNPPKTNPQTVVSDEMKGYNKGNIQFQTKYCRSIYKNLLGVLKFSYTSIPSAITANYEFDTGTYSEHIRTYLKPQLLSAEFGISLRFK